LPPILAAIVLEFESLNVYYGKSHVLRGLSLKVLDGEVVSLIGANAAGKTTTLRTALGLKELTSGSVRFLDADVNGLSTPERVQRGLVLVPEGRQVFTRFTVIENLLMGAYHRPDRNAAAKEMDEVFALFPRLAERRLQKAGSMSGGEQQMLAIGRGLMAKPKCLLLDEPTLGLAPIIVEEIERIIATLAAAGMTILLAEQNAAMALSCSSRAYVLESGAISVEGTTEALEQTDAIRDLFLGP
jgi:branched-chain amino acid transport system ATP-binding protein